MMTKEIKKYENTINILKITPIFLILLLFLFILPSAASSKIVLEGDSYESQNNSNYRLNNSYKVSQMGFGRKFIGEVRLSQSAGIEKNKTNKEEYPAYKAKGPVSIAYGFEGNFKSKNNEVWQVVSDSGKEVAGLELSGKIKDGVMLIRRKINTGPWEIAAEFTNFFGDKKLDKKNLYLIPEEEIKSGVYYQIIIAYKIEKKVGEENGFLWFKKDKMQQRYCIEEYNFFAYYDGNPVQFIEINTNNKINSENKVTAGFKILKNGSSNTIVMKKNHERKYVTDDGQTFIDPGHYIFTITDPLGKNYPYEITVTEGMRLTEPLDGRGFRNYKKTGYSINTSDANIAGDQMHTSLFIGQSSSSSEINKKTYKNNGINVQAFGTNGNGIHLYLRVKNNLPYGWELVSDTYGAKDKETIVDVNTGPVKTGALIVKTSKTNGDFKGIRNYNYQNGLHTTDFENYYQSQGDVLIYTPSGDDILQGLFIQVFYAYEIRKPSTKEEVRCIDRYWFYLCSDNLGAVTFHNLSAIDEVEHALEDYDETTAAVYKHAETMLNDSYTLTGFKIDNSLNPTVTYSAIKNDDSNKMISRTNVFNETGKYVITLENPIKTKKTVVLYVDRMTDDEAFDYYFGDSFIHGKRIYSEGQYPVYEGGKTSYRLSEIDEFHVPLSGYIKNLTSDEIINIEPSREGKQGNLVSTGEYIAVFSTNPKINEELQSGDSRTFTFHFRIIAEGTAPGPVVNQKNLSDYSHTTTTDSYPIYYGLTYASSTKGYITLAFASEEEAVKYAEKIEGGNVELQNDGSYRYIGSFDISQKEKYESNWDLMDAVQFFAKEAVSKQYFDLSEEFTMLSLKDKLVEETSNLRALELDRSVYIFGDNQKPLLTNIKALPIISRKPYKYLEPGSEGIIDAGFEDFEFISDKYRCDSNSVSIIDSNGIKYPIRYNEGVGKQLSKLNCPSGIVTIRESTVYGDINEYQAVYIADGENTSELNITIYDSDGEKQQTFSQKNDGESITTNAFTLDSVSDPLDPYNLILIKDKNDSKVKQFYAADQLSHQPWTEPGSYSIKVVNRLGFNYSIDILVEEFDSVVIYFEGTGTEGLTDIKTDFGAKGVKLPSPTMYGYDFMGFVDKDGNLYDREIAEILFRGSSVLNAVWKAKEFTLTMKDNEGKVIQTEIVRFGDTYTLPKQTVMDQQLASWSINGQQFTGDSFIIDKEEDIVIIPLAAFDADFDIQRNSDTNMINTEIDIDKDGSEGTNLTKDEDPVANSYLKISKWIGIGCVLFVIIIIILNTTKKRKQKTINQDVKEQDSKSNQTNDDGGNEK